MTSHYKKKKRKAVLLIPAAALAVLVLLLVFRPRAAHLNEEEAQGVEQAAEKSGDGIRETVQEFEPHLEEYERLDAFYEEWLAAAVITGISMNEPDFVLEEVYTASETAPDHPLESQGVYVMYQAGEEERCVYAVPLETGRTDQPGTRDIYSEVIGFAGFEEIDPAVVDTTALGTLELEELNTLIQQSERVTIYEN